MAEFKSTYNIFKTPWEDEVFNPQWMNSNKLILPPGGPDDIKNHWDYNREMKIEDVDIWEQIYYEGGGLALYASWCPYAEFYMITNFNLYGNSTEKVETFYGINSGKKAYQRGIQLGMLLSTNKIWVEESEMWLHQTQ